MLTAGKTPTYDDMIEQAKLTVDKTATYDDKREEAVLLLAQEVINLVLKGLGSVPKAELETAVKEKIQSFKPPMTWVSWTLSAEDIDMVYEERLTGPELTDEDYEGIASYFNTCAETDLGEMWQEYLEDAILLHVHGSKYKDEEDDT